MGSFKEFFFFFLHNKFVRNSTYFLDIDPKKKNVEDLKDLGLIDPMGGPY